jgi:predicted nucleotidyltransferase
MNCHQLWPIPEHNALTELRIYSTAPNCQIDDKIDILKENIHKIYHTEFAMCTFVWPNSIKKNLVDERRRGKCLPKKTLELLTHSIQSFKESKGTQKCQPEDSHSESEEDELLHFNVSWFYFGFETLL